MKNLIILFCTFIVTSIACSQSNSENPQLLVHLTRYNILEIDGKKEAFLKERIKTFMKNSREKSNEFIEEKSLGKIQVCNASIHFKDDAGKKYGAYEVVMKKINDAYDELREECASELFNSTFTNLNKKQKEVALKVFPKTIVESGVDHE